MNLALITVLCLLPVPTLSSGGPDVPAGGMPGGLFDTDPVAADVVEAAEFVVEELLDGSNPGYSFISLVDGANIENFNIEVTKAQKQIVAGLNYFMTIQINDDAGCVGVFDATVYRGFDNVLSVTEYGDEILCEDESGEIVGGFSDADPEADNVVAAAEFAVAGLLDEDSIYSFSIPNDYDVEVIKAETQVVQGLNYRLTIEVINNINKCVGSFKALVYQDILGVSMNTFASVQYGDEVSCEDLDFFDCPSTNHYCDSDSEMCCMRGGNQNNLKTSLKPGEYLGLNQWLCRGAYAFGLRDEELSGEATLEVIKKTHNDDTLCETIWMATDDEGFVALGQIVKMRMSGSLALVELEEDRELGERRDLKGSDTWKVVTGKEGVKVNMSNLGRNQNGKVVKIKRGNHQAPFWYIDSKGVEFLNLT